MRREPRKPTSYNSKRHPDAYCRVVSAAQNRMGALAYLGRPLNRDDIHAAAVVIERALRNPTPVRTAHPRSLRHAGRRQFRCEARPVRNTGRVELLEGCRVGRSVWRAPTL
jgi:hypothetical protein